MPVVAAVAVLFVPVLTAPVATADGVTLRCEVDFVAPGLVVECGGTAPTGEGSFRCESPGLVTSIAGVFTVGSASCTATGSSVLVNGKGELTADTVIIDSNTGAVSILAGTAGFTLTEPRTGSSIGIECTGAVLVLTVVPPALHTPSGTCEGDLTLIVPGVGTAEASMVCSGSVTLTSTPLALLVPAGSCVADLIVTVPGVGTARIHGESPAFTVVADPVPVVTLIGPGLGIEVTLVDGTHLAVGCAAVTIDFSQVPVLPDPLSLCTTA